MSHTVLQWLSNQDVGARIAAVAGLLAILAVFIKVAAKICALVKTMFRGLVSTSKIIWCKLNFYPFLDCIRLRWIIFSAGPRALADGANRSLHGVQARDKTTAKLCVAGALAFLGSVDAASAIDLGGTAWGLALASGVKEALSSVRDRGAVDIGALIAEEGLINLSRQFPSESDEAKWRHSEAKIVPIAYIADELAMGNRRKWPSCLADIAGYLKSEPYLHRGWVPVRAADQLRPINRKRLRALRWISASTAPCASLPTIAACLAVLAHAEKTFHVTVTFDKSQIEDNLGRFTN